MAEILSNSGYHASASVGGPLMTSTGLSKGFKKYNFYSPWIKLTLLKWSFLIKRIGLNILIKNIEGEKLDNEI